MRNILLFALLFTSLVLSAQENPTEMAQPIVAEGKLLYKSEMASWYGTDIFLEKYTDHSTIGGYFSYTDKDVPTCIFFSKGTNPTVIGTITFDSTYAVSNANCDLTGRDFNAIEISLYRIRQKAMQEINSDTLFKGYNNTKLNLIPLINGKEKKAYVLTGPEKSGVVIIGNDYLLTFDENDSLVSKKRLHKSIIPIQYGGKEEEGKNIMGAMHTHLPETGDFITATDICTLMLYSKFAKWKTHNVVSEKYLNVWNCETNSLTVIPMDSLKNSDEGQKKRRKKNKE